MKREEEMEERQQIKQQEHEMQMQKMLMQFLGRMIPSRSYPPIPTFDGTPPFVHCIYTHCSLSCYTQILIKYIAA